MSVEQEQEQEHQDQPYKQQGNGNGIYEITEGIHSPQTKAVYQRVFNCFLDHIKIHDLQVLIDFSPKVIKQMIIDYIIFLR
jgi:hypothetical protein